MWLLLTLILVASCTSSEGTATSHKRPEPNVTAYPAATENSVSGDGITLKQNSMNEDAIKQVVMRATAQDTSEALLISYEVENLSDRDLYLWDGMVGFEGTNKVVDKDTAYVFFEEPATVRVLRADLPLPKLRRVGKKQILFARLLAAKTKLTGTIKLKHPVREDSPYYEPPAEDDTEVKKCSRIRLLVGWTAPRQGMQITEVNPGGERWFNIRGVWDAPYQELLEQFVPVEVNLNVYKTEFERQLPVS
jgi:hypothetical protein